MPAPTSSELLVTAGNFSLDDTINPAGRASAAPGGDALYSAVGAAIWRYPVAVVSRVGSDYPDDFMNHVAGLGIGIELIRALPGPTVHYRITNTESGERRYEHVTPAGRLHELSPQGTDLDSIQRAGWVHVAAMPIDVQAAVISRCRQERVPYSLDPHEEYIVGHEQRLAELIEGSFFMPSQLELELLFPDLSAERSSYAVARVAVNRLLAMGARAVAIKLGARGSFVADPTCQVAVPAVATPAVDSTGAGDAFCGGFLAGYLRASSLLLGAVCGSVSAAQVIRGAGALHSELPAPDALREHAAYLLGEVDAAAEGSALLQAGFPWLTP
jgi:sugar/nucleoside kinase (ribokinase family)